MAPTNKDFRFGPSFVQNLNVAVIGASGGIGAALVRTLSKSPSVERIYALSRSVTHLDSPKTTPIRIDLEKEATIKQAAYTLSKDTAELDIVIVASGLLHDSSSISPEKSLKEVHPGSLLTSFNINAVGPLLVAKHFYPYLPKTRKSIFSTLSARVGSISDNHLGGWYSYRMSKAALNMGTKTLSVELARTRPHAICVGLHPGTVETKLSNPYLTNTPTQLFSPHQSADNLLHVISTRCQKDSGLVFDWRGERVPT